MSATSGTRVVWHPALLGWYGVSVNGNNYVTDGAGRIENALESDVAALHAAGFVDLQPIQNADNSGQYGNG